MAVPGSIQNPTCEGTLTIAGTLLNTVAYSVAGLQALWGTQIEYRGTDKVVPYAQGTLSYPRWRVATRHSLPMIITGHVNTSGVAASNPMSQLATHVRALASVVEPPDPTTGNVTKAASLLLPNGTTLTANVIPLGIVPGEVTYNIMRCTLELLIPTGRFT